MKKCSKILMLSLVAILGLTQCTNSPKGLKIGASDILGNTDFQAICYSGYRHLTRDSVPTIDEMKEDMKLLRAMGIKIVRTYDTQGSTHAANLLEAIRQLKNEDSNFEMYVMLGVWIDCLNARTDSVNHELEDVKQNTAEIDKAVEMVKQYPDIVKIIAVGNEAMIHWASGYFVRPTVILKWVNYLQGLKASNTIPANTWITCSDNYESWGGGDPVYQTEDLATLIKAVDYVSMHTYPFHITHYGRSMWVAPEEERNLSKTEQIEAAMNRAMKLSKEQFEATSKYVNSIDPAKQIHIGETGWSTFDNKLFGSKGSKAADEYKDKLFYTKMRAWTNKNQISCFYFEAFDEPWKDASNPAGSENHFGLFTVDGKAKFAIWDLVDKGIYNHLGRSSKPVIKTFDGDSSALISQVLAPPMYDDFGTGKLKFANTNRKLGDPVTEDTYIVLDEMLKPDGTNNMTYPSVMLRINPWNFACEADEISEGEIKMTIGNTDWWGCSLKVAPENQGENLTNFASGKLNFEIKGSPDFDFELGFQTGIYTEGSEVNSYMQFGPKEKYKLSEDWQKISIPLSKFKNPKADMKKVSGIFTVRGGGNHDLKIIQVKNIYYSKN